MSRRFAPLGLATVLALVVSGCSVIDGWFGESADETVDEVIEVAPEGEVSPEIPTGTPETTDLAVPPCETIYSPELTQALLDQVRVGRGDTSGADYGFGTVDSDLVQVLKDVRRDLRISCTWYLPPTESVSVTSIAILAGDAETTVARILDASGAVREDIGGGVLWTLDETTSEVSADYSATEAHFLNEVPCPSSIPETRCAAWISTNYTFGEARLLTLDAATQLGVFED